MAVDADYKQGGEGEAGFRIFFKSVVQLVLLFWIRNLGGHPPHGPVPRGVPGPDGATVDREAPAETD